MKHQHVPPYYAFRMEISQYLKVHVT